MYHSGLYYIWELKEIKYDGCFSSEKNRPKRDGEAVEKVLVAPPKGFTVRPFLHGDVLSRLNSTGRCDILNNDSFITILKTNIQLYIIIF